MKLQPLLFDTSAMYGHPGLALPTWGRWSQPTTTPPVSRQPYHRLREYTVPEVTHEIPADFWEPVVPNSTLNVSENSWSCDDHRSRSRTGVEHSIPIKIEHLTTQRPRMSGMYDDRVCDYNQTSDYDDYHHNVSQNGSLDDHRTDLNSNANGARLKTTDYTRRTRSGDDCGRTLRSRSDLYNTTSTQRSRPSDRYIASDVVEVRPDRSREDIKCTGFQRPYDSRQCDYEDIDAQIAASYGYDMGKDENDVELKVNLPKSQTSSTPVISKLRALRSSNMYVILDNEEEEEVQTYKKTTPSSKTSDNLPGILNSRGEFYDLCNDSCDDDCDCQELVVTLPPPKEKVATLTKESSETPEENVSKTASDNRNISAPPSYPAYKIIRKVISSFGGVVDYIRGDGNCFFRALSKVIYGVESCHGEIRQAMVDIMEKFPKDFEQFIDNPSIQDHFKEMRKDGVWATQAEIYGAASFLQRDIYVLSPDHTGDQYRWLLFSPRLKCSKVDSYHTCHVTLCHTNGNHYDRIAPATGECNCGVAPPKLNGTDVQVDLTLGTEEVV